MRLLMWGASAALGLAVAGDASAERYLVSVVAGPNGDAHVNNDDPDASAEFSRSESGGEEFYRASANAAGGSLFARASRSGPLSPSSTTSAANIEETIHFDELPPGPSDTVAITASLGTAVGATAATGVARAFARISLVFNGGQCSFTSSAHSINGPDSFGSCNTPDGTAGGGSVQLVLTRDQLLASNLQVDVFASVSAELEDLGQGLVSAVATASGGASLSRGNGDVPGTVYIDIDPPLEHSYTGSVTVFPVPEPGAPLLAAIGGAVLLAARAGSRRTR